MVSNDAAGIITDILAGNTDTKVNPYWGKWAIYDGKTRRPAAYKTGTTSDNRDVAAYGYLAPPADDSTPALAVGVWMGNSDNSPNDGKLSLDTSAPLWSAILTEISKGLPIAKFERPSDLETATVDAFTGLQPGPFTTATIDEIFIPGTVPTQKETIRVTRQIDSATGLLWQDGCAGPMVNEGFFDLTQVDASYPAWQKADIEWGARAAKGTGVKGGPEGTRTSYFYNNSLRTLWQDVGSAIRPYRALSRGAAAGLRPVRRTVPHAVRSVPGSVSFAERPAADGHGSGRRVPIAGDRQRQPDGLGLCRRQRQAGQSRPGLRRRRRETRPRHPTAHRQQRRPDPARAFQDPRLPVVPSRGRRRLKGSG